MSRSGNKIWHAVSNDLRETWRLQLKRVACYDVDLKIESHPVYYSLVIHIACYGGALVKKLLKCHRLTIRFPRNIMSLPIQIQAPLHASPVLVTQPPLVRVPSLMQMSPHQIDNVAMLPELLAVINSPIERSETKIAGALTYQQLQVKHRGVKQYVFQKFRRPIVSKLKGLSATLFKMSPKKRALPIVRMAIPPHRFSKTHRELFRDRLAKKAGVAAQDIQIIGVYDRIYLGLYQSISQTPEGALLCIPKSNSDPSLNTKKHESSYMIMGKSYKHPGRNFQIIVSLQEFENVQSS